MSYTGFGIHHVNCFFVGKRSLHLLLRENVTRSKDLIARRVKCGNVAIRSGYIDKVDNDDKFLFFYSFGFPFEDGKRISSYLLYKVFFNKFTTRCLLVGYLVYGY